MESGNIAVNLASSLRFDPGWLKLIAQSNMPPAPELNDVLSVREYTEKILATVFKLAPYPTDVTETKTELDSPDGTHKFTVSRFATAAHRSPAPGEAPQAAVLYLHGGGMIACTVEIFAPAIARHVDSTGVQFFAVDYPRAPEYPAPAAVNDCYEALKWLSANAAEMNIDPTRLIVMGDSAGGGLAAGTAILARDRGLDPPLAKQVLIYPMLDDQTTSTSDSPINEFLTWTSKDNTMAWKAYLGADRYGNPDADILPSEAPARLKSYKGLPSTYIDIGGLDLFLNENLHYAAKVAAAHIEVELHVYPGLPHGFESAAATVKVAGQAIQNRIRAIQSV